MTNFDHLRSAFVRWLDTALPTLTPSSSVDFHVDCDDGLPADTINSSLDLFSWVVDNLAGRLTGKLVMLMIPLRNGALLDTATPRWTDLASQLSRTPPSIYVMNVSAFLQPDPAQRYVSAIDIPGIAGEPLAAYYRCWRNPDDPVEEGWSRDVQIVSLRVVATSDSST